MQPNFQFRVEEPREAAAEPSLGRNHAAAKLKRILDSRFSARRIKMEARNHLKSAVWRRTTSFLPERLYIRSNVSSPASRCGQMCWRFQAEVGACTSAGAPAARARAELQKRGFMSFCQAGKHGHGLTFPSRARGAPLHPPATRAHPHPPSALCHDITEAVVKAPALDGRGFTPPPYYTLTQ